MLTEKKIYRTAMYVRLSKGDVDRDGMAKVESNSVKNQKMLIEQYIEAHDDLELVREYIDDGFTGVNFDRPQMKAMLADVDAGLIDCIVVKDLSRFGRERIETGTYIARTFKQKGIRFIAINDHYDTLTADGAETHIVMPIKALTNDYYSKDISTKVRSSQRIKREKGEFVGSFTPYGYRKADENRNQLVPDEPAAKVVKEIFNKKMVGYSASSIAKHLNEQGILSPAEYKRSQGMQFLTVYGKCSGSKWSAQTVLRLLKNEVYIGRLAQGKREQVSYKVRKQVDIPSEQWIRCDDAHEAIVDRSVFDTVQMLLDRDTISAKGDKCSYLYSGLIFCEDCGSSMIRRNYYKKPEAPAYFICSAKNLRNSCSRHAIREDVVNRGVEHFLHEFIDSLQDKEHMMEELEGMEITYSNADAHADEIKRLRSELDEVGVYQRALYQDLDSGIIKERQFRRYRMKYEERRKELAAAIKEHEECIRIAEERDAETDERLAACKEKLNVDGLDRKLVVTFIDRILVSEDGKMNIVARFGV